MVRIKLKLIDKTQHLVMLKNRYVSIRIKKEKIDKEMIKKNGLWGKS